MASAKKSIETVREELRVLNSAADDAASAVNTASGAGSWLSPEFWTMASAAATNLVTVAVLIGWVNHTDADAMLKAVSALLGASQVLVLNTALIWKFLTGRTEVRAAMISAQYRYMETIAVEKFRAEQRL